RLGQTEVGTKSGNRLAPVPHEILVLDGYVVDGIALGGQETGVDSLPVLEKDLCPVPAPGAWPILPVLQGDETVDHVTRQMNDACPGEELTEKDADGRVVANLFETPARLPVTPSRVGEKSAQERPCG